MLPSFPLPLWERVASPGGGDEGSAKTGEGFSRHSHVWRETPHRSEFVSTIGVALSHKGRGRINAHRV